MDTPVDKHSAARLRLSRESAAESRDGSEGSERAVDMIEIAELAFLDPLAESLNRLLIAVADSDVEELADLLCLVRHLDRERVADGYRLFAEDMLPGIEGRPW